MPIGAKDSMEFFRSVRELQEGKHPLAPRPKGDTGTGDRASGRRARCGFARCQAFASPSGSGYCSHHEQAFTPVGERVSDARWFKCATPDCPNQRRWRVRHPEEECEWCKECADRIHADAVAGTKPDEPL